jgi:hypothetical protein
MPGCTQREEMEVTIRLDQVDRQAHTRSTWPEWSRKLEKLYGGPAKVTTRGEHITSAFWVVPLHCISLRKGKRQLSATQRQALAERLAKTKPTRQTPYPVAVSPAIPENRHN